MLYTDDDELTCTDMECTRDNDNGFGWRDNDGYFSCNSWFCGELTDERACYRFHSALSHCVREFVAEYDWYTHISWSHLFDMICDDSDSKEDFCDCYHVISKAVTELPQNAKDQQGTVFSGFPVRMTSKYMNIKGTYLRQLSTLTDLVDNNSPDKVSFILSGHILANEIYFFHNYATLHYTPYSTSVHCRIEPPPAKIKKEY